MPFSSISSSGSFFLGLLGYHAWLWPSQVPPQAGEPASFRAPKSWTTETCFQSTLGFPPLLLSLEDLFCEICKSREIYSASRLDSLSGEQKTKAALDLDRGTKIEILEHLIPWDRLQPPH